MPYLSQPDPGADFAPFVFLKSRLGFVPNLFRAQTLLPRLLEAQQRIAAALLLEESALSRHRKERMLFAVAASLGSTCCATEHHRLLLDLGETEESLRRLSIDPPAAASDRDERLLLDLALQLAHHPGAVTDERIASLRDAGIDDARLIDTVLTAGLARFLCCVAAGLGVEPDFDPPAWLGAAANPPAPDEPPEGAGSGAGPAARFPLLPPGAAAHHLRPLQESFGFVPRLFRASGLRMEAVGAQVDALRLILLNEEVLSRVRKESMLLVVSALNRNAYCVAVHCELMRMLGVDEALSERIAIDHRGAGLPEPDAALLDHALKLARSPGEMGPDDVATLRRHGFSEEQVLETVVMVALTQFLNTVQAGLGVEPDFPPRPRLSFRAPDRVNPPGLPVNPMEAEDLLLVRRVQSGDMGAFETLVRRHDRRVYRTLIGVLGGPEDAEDALQNVFLKVYSHIGGFRGDARFSTWLTRIAINEGLMRLRSRRPTESLEEAGEPAVEVVSRDLRPWEEDPESACSRGETRALVERELARLPAPYRLAVMLRDIEQLSTEEAAAAMSVPVPTLKTRLFRGRLMLRDALAPHFQARGKGGAHA